MSPSGCRVGFQVAAEGMAGPDRAGAMTRPSVAKIISASSATWAMARALSSLNCFRSALRRAVISSEVNSKEEMIHESLFEDVRRF